MLKKVYAARVNPIDRLTVSNMPGIKTSAFLKLNKSVFLATSLTIYSFPDVGNNNAGSVELIALPF